MNVGEVARLTGLPVKTVRYYEEIGLVSPERRANGYRSYSKAEVHALRFVGAARRLGFSIDDCRTLLSLYRDRNRASADVRRIAEKHVEEIEQRMAELEAMKRTLSHLIEACHGDERPDCPILDGLAALEEREEVDA